MENHKKTEIRDLLLGKLSLEEKNLLIKEIKNNKVLKLEYTIQQIMLKKSIKGTVEDIIMGVVPSVVSVGAPASLEKMGIAAFADEDPKPGTDLPVTDETISDFLEGEELDDEELDDEEL